MFVKAIEKAANFTRPIHIIERLYGSHEVFPGSATLFFVNADGWALTCKHVAKILVGADKLARQKTAFESEFKTMRGKKKEKQIRKELEQKYSLNNKIVYEVKIQFISCLEGKLGVKIIEHPTLDLALLHFKDYSQLLCSVFPIFPKDTSILKQGKYLCRLGFPFPEFTNFEFLHETDSIRWTETGRQYSPSYPIEGMLTRHLSIDEEHVIGFELSTPGLRGQSGGPAFDMDGKVWGIQSATNHLDLNFDVDMVVIRNGENRRIRDSAFLHVGHCIHVDILKEFMQQHSVFFQEE